MALSVKMSLSQGLDVFCAAEAGCYTRQGRRPSCSGRNPNPTLCILNYNLSPVRRSAFSVLSSRPLAWVVNGRSSFVPRVRLRNAGTRASEADEGLETFDWGEGSIVIPKFNENYFPVDENGAIIDIPSPRKKKKPKQVTAKLDADGNPVVRRKRTSRPKEVPINPDPDSDEKGPRQLRTAKDIGQAKQAAKLAVVRRAKAKEAAARKRARERAKAEATKATESESGQDEEGGAETQEETEAEISETAPPASEEPQDDPFAEEDEDALLAELEELEARAEISEAGRRQLAALRRNRKGRLMSELRATTLKQLSHKTEEKRVELLAMSSKVEKRWYVVNCTVPEADVAAAFRERLAMYAPDEEIDVRTPELPAVKILKNGEARHFSTFVTNNVLFICARLTPQVLQAMSATPGLYNIEGAENKGVMSVAAGMQAERFVKMIEDAEREVQETVAAAQAKMEKEKEEAAKRKAEAAAARKGKKEQTLPEEPELEGGGNGVPQESEGLIEAPAANVKYAVGSDVMVARGPFAGLTGEVTTRDGEKQELKVKIMILGQYTEVDVKFKDVRPVKAPASKTPAFDPFRREVPLPSSSGATERRPEESQYTSTLEWGLRGSDNTASSNGLENDADWLRSGLGSETDGSGVNMDWLRSGSRGESGSGQDEEDETNRVPLRSGVGVEVKKGPFKGCTGHVVDVLLEKGLITVQIPDEGEIQFQPRDVSPEDGGSWSLPEGFQVISAPVKQLDLPKPKKQLLWLDEGEEEAEPKRELGADGRPKDPDWSAFERKPRGGVENDLEADRADPRQAEIRWQKLSITTPEGKTKRLMVKYLGTNGDNSAEMLLTEDLEVVTAVWRRLTPVGKAKGRVKKEKKKTKDAQMPAFM